MNILGSQQSLFNDELEHLRSKLTEAEKQLGTASGKTEQKILKDMIAVLKQQVRIAEENDPACIKAREKEAAEKKHLAEKKKKERKESTYNKTPIIVGALIIAFTIGLCVMVGINAAMMKTYVSLFGVSTGIVLLVLGIIFTCIIFTAGFNKLYAIGAILLILGGTCMGAGSTVSKDAPHGSSGTVIGGMFLICAGVIFIVGYYWYNTNNREQVKTKRREEAAKAAAKAATDAAIKVRYDNFCKTYPNIGRLREKKNSRLASYLRNAAVVSKPLRTTDVSYNLAMQDLYFEQKSKVREYLYEYESSYDELVAELKKLSGSKEFLDYEAQEHEKAKSLYDQI